jgi:hypothetical protein
MGLGDFFAAVQTQVTTTLTALGQPIPAFDVGADRLMVEGAPPRIVWVPLRERILGPHAQGGDGVTNPRPLRTRHAQVQVRIWGVGSPPSAVNDLAATEALINHLVAAINAVGWGAWDATGGDWSLAQGSTTRLGIVYVLDLEVQIPITREADVLHVVSSMPITIPDPLSS